MGALAVGGVARAAGPTRGKLTGWLFLVGTVIVLAYAARASPAETDTRDFVYRWTTVVAGSIQVVVMLGLLLWIAAGGPARELFALRRPRSWSRAAGLVLGVLVATLAVAAALEPILGAGEEQGLTPEGWDSSRAPQFAASFVLIAFLVPIAEELTFRGLGYSLVEPRIGVLGAIAVTGLLFGLAHGLLRGLPILAAFGAALAWLRARTDSVLPAIVAHALFNGFALIASVTIEVET